MSPKVTRLPPLSGRDRRAFAREAARAEGLYNGLMSEANGQRAAAERSTRAAEEAIRAADTLECEAWSGALRFGMDVQQSPTIGQAINADYIELHITCRRCRQARRVDITKIRRKSETRLWALESSMTCKPCSEEIHTEAVAQNKMSYRPKATITDLCKPYRPAPPEPPPVRKTAARS